MTPNVVGLPADREVATQSHIDATAQSYGPSGIRDFHVGCRQVRSSVKRAEQNMGERAHFFDSVVRKLRPTPCHVRACVDLECLAGKAERRKIDGQRPLVVTADLDGCSEPPVDVFGDRCVPSIRVDVAEANQLTEAR